MQTGKVEGNGAVGMTRKDKNVYASSCFVTQVVEGHGGF